MDYFVVKNWKNFQQYKDRNPDWIKLYQDLLDDYEFNQMPEADQIHLVKIWLLFAKDNPPNSDKIKPLPCDVKFISDRVNAKRKVRLDRLLQSSFLEKYIVKDTGCTDLIQPRTPYKEDNQEKYKPYKQEEERENKLTPPPEFLKILKTCQGIRRVVFGVLEPFDDPRDGAIVQEFLDQGYTVKQIQIGFFLFCVWDDPYLLNKPRTIYDSLDQSGREWFAEMAEHLFDGGFRTAGGVAERPAFEEPSLELIADRVKLGFALLESHPPGVVD